MTGKEVHSLTAAAWEASTSTQDRNEPPRPTAFGALLRVPGVLSCTRRPRVNWNRYRSRLMITESFSMTSIPVSYCPLCL